MIQAFPLYFEMLNLEPHFLFIPFVCVVWWGFFGFVLGLGLFSVDFFFFFFYMTYSSSWLLCFCPKGPLPPPAFFHP